MKLTAISIFPEYFEVVKLSLIGKAIESGIIEFKSVDLRDFTHDNHHTVDDTPFGGGAGMVMKPEPWGEALDNAIAESEGLVDLIILTPGGRKFDQRYAAELSNARSLIFACGRYEGIDARVGKFYGGMQNVRVHEISIGDYVLNGGEVAAVAMIEAICRLIPGVIGNTQSLADESHADGLLEYPSYTKPQSWRGFEVPEVLLSGHHAEIAAWRKEQSLKRTQENRPDLL